MRKFCARKILHAVLDLLPLLIIPIFACAVRSDNNYEPISTTVSGYEVREKYHTNEVNSVSDLIEGNIYYCDEINIGLYDSFYNFTLNIYKFDNFEIIDSDYSIDEVYAQNYDSNLNNYLQIILYDDGTDGDILVYFTNENNYTAVLFEPYTVEVNCLIFTNCYFTFTNNEENSFQQYVLDIFEYNPTSSNYNVLEYVYNEEIVLDKTDVGSQLMYSLYIPIKDHFNMLNVFNFGDIYNWLQLNVFGGQAPISIFIVYNVIVYEFIMDLIFLMYTVFMFIIDFATNLLEHALSWSNYGGSKRL